MPQIVNKKSVLEMAMGAIAEITDYEVEQPASDFLLRLDKDGRPALYEADGGAWKLEAKRNIAAYLGEQLADLVDRYTAQYLVQDMKQYGFHMDDVFQGFNLTPVIREVEGLLKDGTINIGDNDLLKVHLLNTALKVENDSGRCKLVKMSAADHIDGCAALMDGMTVRQKWCAEIGGQLKNAG